MQIISYCHLALFSEKTDNWHGSLIPFTRANAESVGLSWVSHSTLIYTSELILCSTNWHGRFSFMRKS